MSGFILNSPSDLVKTFLRLSLFFVFAAHLYSCLDKLANPKVLTVTSTVFSPEVEFPPKVMVTYMIMIMKPLI